MIGQVLLAAATIAAAQLDADMRAVAALPGEPHVVSAAGFAGEKPASTIENLLPFEADTKRRLVIVGGLDGDDRAAHAVVDAVRWFKTSASASIRERWQLSALPLGGSDNRQVRRWLTFQAPDVAIEVVASSDTLAGSLGPLIGSDDPLHSVRLITTQPTAAVETMQRELASREVARSALRQTILNRIARDPLDIARVLARRYPQTARCQLHRGGGVGEHTWRRRRPCCWPPWPAAFGSAGLTQHISRMSGARGARCWRT